MPLTFERALLLLLIAAVVAMLSRKLHLPYSVGLVAAGIGLTFLPWAFEVGLTKELLFTGLLPPLIFEAAFYLDWELLKRDLSVVLVLATVGVVLCAAVTTAGMHFLAHWEWTGAMLFGVLIAATDPVAVIAIFRDAKARGRLVLLVEAESLFNDATAAVAFAIAVELAMGHTLTGWQMVGRLLVTVGGSILCGALVAAVALVLIGRTQDHLVEITFTTVAAYGSFLLADNIHGSGVLATLVAGLVLGNFGSMGTISDRGREALHAFWEYAAFVANSLVFLMIGMEAALQNFPAVWVTALVAIGLVTLGRAAAVYPCCALFAWSRWQVPLRHQNVLFWGGLRGALALALSLALPAGAPRREAIITISFAVVAFSIFVQGLTVTKVLRHATPPSR
jgi:CPA1 family monovalent cation:H+ antiporter